MTVSSVSSTDQSSLIQQLLASLQTTVTSTFNGIDSADSTGSTTAAGQSSAAPAGPPPGPPPPRPDGAGSDLFSSDTLAGLMQAQEQPTTASDAAAKLISGADTDGSGTLSLAEIEQALDGSSSSTDASASTSSTTSASTDASSALQAAFAKLDTNGDGQLSQDEIASGLQKMGGRHGHHHHHGAYAAAVSATDATSTTASTAATATAGSDTGATASMDVTA